MTKKNRISLFFLLLLIIILIFTNRRQYKYNLKVENDLKNSIVNLINQNNIYNIHQLEELNIYSKNYDNFVVAHGYFVSLYNEIIINKGLDNGINSNDAVVNQNGLVGFVTKTYKNKSIVTLLGDYNNEVSVKVNNQYGILKSINGKLIVSGISSTDVSVNDIVYTSGLTNVLSGINIGTVEKINNKDDIFKTELEIKNIDNYDNYNFFIVLGNK